MTNKVRRGAIRATMPSDISDHVSFFDRFATKVNRFVSRAWFFSLCALIVLIWIPSYALFGNIDTWQLVINTLTTIVTFLLVALLQNTQTRADEATQQKLNAVAQALDALLARADTQQDTTKDRAELRAAVGLENRESS